MMRNSILEEVTDAAGESSKIPRLQRALQEFDENFDVIGLINFNWDHTVRPRAPSSRASMPSATWLAKRRILDVQIVGYGTEYYSGAVTAPPA